MILRHGLENQRTVCNFSISTVADVECGPIQASRAVAEKPHDAVVKLDTYRNLERQRAVLSATARLSCL